MKTCIKCLRELTDDMFYISKANRLSSSCKECTKKYNKLRYSTQEYREYARARYEALTPEQKTIFNQTKYRTRKANGCKQSIIKSHKYARRLLEVAIETKKITKPSTCSQCGAKNIKINAHHDDYFKPLDVIWLCTSCHGKLHRLTSI